MGKFRRASLQSILYGNQIFFTDDYTWATWVCGFIFFEEDVRIETVEKVVNERILTIPRFRSVYSRKRKGFEEIDIEKEFDKEYHIVVVDEIFNIDQIRHDYCDDVYKRFDFDPKKPLWRFVYFPQIEDGRSLLLTTIAHAIGDGISQLEILFRILDKPEESQTEDAEALRPAQRRRVQKSSFGPLNKSRIFLGGIIEAFTAIFGAPDSNNPLARSDTHKTGVKRSTFTDAIPFEKVNQLKNKYSGATINDILVALLTLTINAYFKELEEETGEKIIKKRQKIRAGFPINMRKAGQDPFRDGSPHNLLALGVLKFFLNPKSRTDLVWKVKRYLDKVKLSPSPALQSKIGNVLLGIIPEKQATILFSNLSSTTTVSLSNVPGPKKASAVEGFRVQDLQFLGSAPIGCYFGLISYDGKVSCGITLDETTSADPIALSKHWKIEFEKLYEESMRYEREIPRPSSRFGKFLDSL